MVDYNQYLKQNVNTTSLTKIEDVSYIFNRKWLIKMSIWEKDIMGYHKLKSKIELTILNIARSMMSFQSFR